MFPSVGVIHNPLLAHIARVAAGALYPALQELMVGTDLREAKPDSAKCHFLKLRSNHLCMGWLQPHTQGARCHASKDLGTQDKAAQQQHPSRGPAGSWLGSTAPLKVSPEPSQAPSCPCPHSMSPLPPHNSLPRHSSPGMPPPAYFAGDPKPPSVSLG